MIVRLIALIHLSIRPSFQCVSVMIKNFIRIYLFYWLYQMNELRRLLAFVAYFIRLLFFVGAFTCLTYHITRL